MKSNYSFMRNWLKNLKNLALFLPAVFATIDLSAQDGNAFVCTKGKTHFFTAAFAGDIEATSDWTVCVINTKSNRVFAKIRQSTFSFKQKLMQEHFNENYMETDKYPYATLDMIIADKIDYSKDGVYDVTLKGSLEMHGTKTNREIRGKLTVKNGQPVGATAVFVIKFSDFKIKIPNIVGATVADEVKVDVDFLFTKYEGYDIK